MTPRSGMDALSSTERRCLRLAARGLSSKEIAVEIGTSEGMVNNHVASARAKLGGITRRAAARLLVEHESGHVADAWVQSSHMHSAHHAPPQETVLIPTDRPQQSAPAQVQEERVHIAIDPRPGERRGLLHDLGPFGRIGLVFIVAASIAVILLAAPALAREFGPLANSIVSIID